MEDVETKPGEEQDWQTKFVRILDSHRFEAIVVVWPRWAKMQATWDELLYLRERLRGTPLPPIFAIHDDRAAKIEQGQFMILEEGDRSEYLRGVHHLSMTALPYSGREDFQRAVATLVDELAPVRMVEPVAFVEDAESA